MCYTEIQVFQIFPLGGENDLIYVGFWLSVGARKDNGNTNELLSIGCYKQNKIIIMILTLDFMVFECKVFLLLKRLSHSISTCWIESYLLDYEETSRNDFVLLSDNALIPY